MFCTKCGMENPEDAVFCGGCGKPMKKPKASAGGAAATPDPVSSGVQPVPTAMPGAQATVSSTSAPSASPAVSTASSVSAARTSSQPTGAAADQTAEKIRGVAREAVGLAGDMAKSARSVRNARAQAGCIICGPLYTLIAIGMLSQPGAGEYTAFAYGLLAYGIWLTVGFFTKGWRIVIY